MPKQMLTYLYAYKISPSFTFYRNHLCLGLFAVFVGLFITNEQLTAQTTTQLTPQAQISILTASPGDEVYTLFGHTAIRVKDSANGLDVVYNYGIFDFQTPNFLMKFLRGRLPYQLGAQRFRSFSRVYQRENRGVKEQILELSPKETQEFWNFLQNNYKPENRAYLYDFFFDNCSSRIRDVLNVVLTDKLAWKTQAQNPTFRNLLDEYLVETPWTDFGIDLIIGAVADQKADVQDQMFLPDYLHDYMATATTQDTVVTLGLVNKENVLIERIATEKKPILVTPLIVFIALLLLALGIMPVKKNWVNRTFDRVWFFFLGLSGLIMLFMWVGTDHDATKLNWNIIWANPLYLVFFTMMLFNKSGRALSGIWWAIATISVVTLLGWSVIPQQFHIAVIPIILTIAVRAIYNAKYSIPNSKTS
ncbi:MAG: DUF4105 domain-containing protein [Chitinophagales bacterium]